MQVELLVVLLVALLVVIQVPMEIQFQAPTDAQLGMMSMSSMVLYLLHAQIRQQMKSAQGLSEQNT